MTQLASSHPRFLNGFCQPSLAFTHLVLIILMHIDTALLRLPPSFRHRVIGISLVYYLRNELFAVIDQGEFGAGISAGWIASAAPSSTRRVRRVKTERIRKMIIRRFIRRKIVRPRRMIVVVGGGR